MEFVLRQSFWLLIAQSLVRVVSFFYTIYLAKVLGVENFGLYIVAFTYFSLISAASDFGFNRYLIREVSKDESNLSELLCNISIFRLAFSAILFAVFATFLYFIDSDKERVLFSLLAVLAVLPQTLAQSFDGIFIALRKLQYSAVSLAVASLSMALIGYILVNSGYQVLGAVNALIISQFVYLTIALILLLRNSPHSIFASVNLMTIKSLIKGSLPYGFIGILGLLYFRIDTVMLSYLKGDFETGIYGAGYRFLEAVTFIPSIFAAVLFPMLAKLHQSDILKVRKVYFKSIKITAGVGLIIFFAYLLILPGVIKSVLPSYIDAIPVIYILSLAIPFMFAHVPAVQVLLSTDKFLKPVIYLSVAMLLFNILGNLVFIPNYGFIGAAWITTASEILSFIVFFLFVMKKVFKKQSL